MSGIVRKVDDLGRIVIPKELRKNLNIKNSDDLEISISEDKIILEKFYRLKNLKETLNNYFCILEKFLSAEFIITDKENIILKSKKINIEDNRLTHSILELMNLRKSIIDNNKLKITNELEISKNYYFSPIIINTDILGSIILYSDNKITKEDLLIVDIFIFLLKEKLE